MAEEQITRTGDLLDYLCPDAVHRVGGLRLWADRFHVTGLTVPLAPFAALTPNVSTFNLHHHDAPSGMEEHEVSLALGTEMTGQDARVARVKPTEGVDSDKLVRK
jgi:hypothetical protein